MACARWVPVTANFTPHETVYGHWKQYVIGCEAVGKKPTGDDDKKKIADARRTYTALRKRIETANDELRLDLMLLEPPAKTAANEKDLLKLPDFIKDVIKAKGVPLGKGVSISPVIKFDFKAMKLKEFGLTITWRF